jgi:hypothetical protein
MRPVLTTFLIATLAFAGCRGEEVPRGDEPVGHQPPADTRFNATVTGDLSRGISGEARYVVNARGLLVAIELDQSGDTRSGISLSMDPVPVGTQSFVILDEGAQAGTPRFEAHYEEDGRSFSALEGALQLEQAAGGRLAGTFEVTMRGYRHDIGDETMEIVVAGSFIATRARASSDNQ